jgi:hypothetical protein
MDQRCVEYTNEDKVTSLSNVLLQWYMYIYCSFNNKFQLVGSLNKLFYLL